MRKHIFHIFLLISAIGFSQEKPIVKSQVDTTNIRIGEQFEYKITVQETESIIISKLDKLIGLEVISEKAIDTLKNRLVKKYILTGFDSGAYYIPQQQIFIRGKLHNTDSILINVATVAVDTIKQPVFPIKAIKNEPYRLDDAKPYIWKTLLGLLLLGILLYFILKKKKETVAKIVVPLLAPYEEAVQKLQHLDEKLLWQNNQVKKYYSELTEIVRVYIERELNVPALESTTDELIETLIDFNDSKTIVTSKETLKKLQELLREADLVKFAKSKPLSEEIEDNRRDAQEIIDTLKPLPIKENDELE